MKRILNYLKRIKNNTHLSRNADRFVVQEFTLADCWGYIIYLLSMPKNALHYEIIYAGKLRVELCGHGHTCTTSKALYNSIYIGVKMPSFSRWTLTLLHGIFWASIFILWLYLICYRWWWYLMTVIDMRCMILIIFMSRIP